MKFGDHLKEERQKKYLTQQEVASEFNVSRQTVSSWETEHSYPDIESLLHLSDYYQVSLDTLLKEDTGMIEYLKKQEILKSIKPVIRILMVIDIIFLLILVISSFDAVKANSITRLIIFMMGILNVLALLKLESFQTKLTGQKYNHPKIQKMTIYLLPLALVGGIGSMLFKQYELSGVFSGIAFGIGIAWIINKFKKN